jgi:hypothetical protein
VSQSKEQTEEKHLSLSLNSLNSNSSSLSLQYFDLVVLLPTSRLFDVSLAHITSCLATATTPTNNTTQRSRAMKALSSILSASPSLLATHLLARSDLQLAMKQALLDSSTRLVFRGLGEKERKASCFNSLFLSVREATIDLVGRFMLAGGKEREKFLSFFASQFGHFLSF